MASADSGAASTARGLRVEHVTNSLEQIELWVGAVRAALIGLEPQMPLPMAGARAEALFTSTIRVQKSCPPPPFTPKPKPPKKKRSPKEEKKKK
jgi:hypothetical protein